MTTRLNRLLPLVGVLVLAAPVAAQDLPPVRDDVFEGPERTYAAHPFDQQHIVVDVRIDPDERSVTGHTELHIRPLEPMRSMRLMAADMVVDSVIVTAGSLRFRAPFVQSGFDSLVVTLAPEEVLEDSVSGDADSDMTATEPDSLGEETESSIAPAPPALEEPFAVTTYYRAHPTIGLYFVPPADHEEAERVQVWSQGETEGNRHWFPLFDVPDDKLTSEVIVTIDSAYTVVSNGTIESDRVNDDGTRTVHFNQSRPHSPYLISIAADDYVSIRSHATLEDGTRVPLAYHVLPERAADVERTLGATPEIIAYFSEILGVPYPWARYDQAFVRDFMWGGMENTGASTLTDRIILDTRAVLDYNPENLVAHEIAHQWFGDLITAQHWSHAWLHEGLTSYLEALNTERSRGREDFLLEMQANADAYLRESREYLRPIVWNRWIEPMNVFDRHFFDKGSWVAHMLRSEVGDEVFFAILERFLKDNAYQAVTTDDFQAAVESVTGVDQSGFFDQWLYAAGHPVIDVRTSYDAGQGRLRVVVTQTQEGALVPSVFHFPLEIEIQTLGGAERHTVDITQREHDFTFEVDMPPRFVLPNPDLTVLADIRVEQSAGAWVAQLRYALEPVSRMLAARSLAAFADEPALLVGLKNAFDVEQHPEVRREIVRTISLLPNDAAKERALLEATRDERAPVREIAVTALGTFEGSAAVADRLFEIAQNEPSYRTQGMAVVALARIGAPTAVDVFRSALITPSYREYVRRAALQALRHLDLPATEQIRIATEFSAPGQPTDARVAAVAYLGVLASEQRRALDRLLDLAGDDTYDVRQAAIVALERVNDPRAAEALATRLAEEPEPKLRERLREAGQKWAHSFAP